MRKYNIYAKYDLILCKTIKENVKKGVNFSVLIVYLILFSRPKTPLFTSFKAVNEMKLVNNHYRSVVNVSIEYFMITSGVE